MTNVAFERQVFVNDMSIKFGYEPNEIKDMLEKKFDKFDIYRVDEYENYLAECRSRTKFTSSKDIKPKAVFAEGFMCPICGKPVIVDDRWFGRYTRTFGWRCSDAGISHFLQWKANNIRRNQGLQFVFQEREG